MHAREFRRAMDRQLARLAAFKGRALGGEGTATAAGTTAEWTCGSLAAVTALSCVLYACLPRPTSTLADCQSADFLPVQVQPSMATDCFAFSGTPALALSTEKAKDHSPSCCASPQGAPGCTSMAMAGNCTGVVCFLCPTVLCACTAVWWCMGCGMSVAVFGALWRAQSSAQKEAAPAHVLEVYLQREDGPLKLCSLSSSTTVAEVQRMFMGIRAPNLQNQDRNKIANFQESTYLKCKLKVLQPEQTLEECGIQQHATIRLMWRRGLRGGGACMSTPSVRVGPAVTADMRGGAAETSAAGLEAPGAAERTPARQDERAPVCPDGPARARRVDGLGVKGVDTSRAPNRAVSLRWLIQFRKEQAGTTHSFDAVDFIAKRHGGGSKLTVTVDGLAEHLKRRLEAERERDGVRTEVRFEEIPFEKLSTANVVDAYVRPSCEARDESFAVTHVPASGLSSPDYFVSHGWGNSFVDLVDTLENYFLGAAADDVYVWLDIFAVNQKAGRAMQELEDGAALAEVIDNSVACLVVLDRGLLPLTRLWCLFEVGSSPTDKLQMLTPPGMGDGEVVDAARRVDVDKALCFSPEDRKMIYAGIEKKFGSSKELTEQLQLRLMLRPMVYAADTTALLRRAKGETFRLDALRDFVRGGGGRAAVIEGVAGEGKSTISAKMVGEENIVDAVHMCKRSDVSRQNPLLVAHSLAYQLALRRPEDMRCAILGLDADQLKRARSDADEAVTVLLLQPLKAIPEGEHVVLLMDAMDEGAVGGAGRNAPGEVLQKVMKATSGTNKVSVVMTTRPDVNAVRAVRVAMGVPSGEEDRQRWLSFAPASLRGGGDGIKSGGEEDGGGRLLRLLTEELHRRNLRAPTDLDDAYRAFFQATPLGEAERRLLVTVAAAREPLTEAHLQDLGLLAAVDGLPGGGLLFERREHRLQALHGSVLEWLMDPSRAGDFYAVPTSGHVELSRRSLEVLKRGGGGPVVEYALRHGHVHLAAALEAEATGAEATGAGALHPKKTWVL